MRWKVQGALVVTFNHQIVMHREALNIARKRREECLKLRELCLMAPWISVGHIDMKGNGPRFNGHRGLADRP